jgi:hypothetical protein
VALLILCCWPFPYLFFFYLRLSAPTNSQVTLKIDRKCERKTDAPECVQDELNPCL